MTNQDKPANRTMTNLAVDIAIFFAFLIATAPQFSGLAVHEWLGISLGAGVITHLLLHWQWIVATTRRFLTNAPRQARTNYVLNALLFIDFTLITFSGLMISQVAMPVLGIQLPANFTWRGLHALAANGALLLVGLHVALHWQWIVNTAGRLFRRPIKAPRLAVNAVRAEVRS